VAYINKIAPLGLARVAAPVAVPWIALFPGFIPRTMTVLSVVVAPVALNGFILYRFFGEFVPWNYGVLYGACSLIDLVAGLAVFGYAERLGENTDWRALKPKR
jgi:hypothetical protein